MNRRTLLVVSLVLLLILTSCQTATPAPGTAPTSSTAGEAQKQAEPTAQVSNPEAAPNTEGYPAPAAGSGEVPAIAEAYPPAAGDENMENGEFFIDKVELRPSADNPAVTEVFVEGSLPTSCNQVRTRVTPPDKDNKVIITIYTLIPKDSVCAQATAPYAKVIARLGGYPAGKYSVVVNDQPAGEFTIQ